MTGLSLNFTIEDHGIAAQIGKEVSELQDEFGRNLAEAIPEVMKGSRSGRLYRKGRFGRGARRGLGTTARGRGSRIHRASAPGEPLASDTGKTARSVSVRRMSKGVVRIRVEGALGYWEFRDTGRRPTLYPAIELAAQRTFGGYGK
jgi:hypothetical protein